MNSLTSPKKVRVLGQAMIEVLLILVLVVIAVGTGPNNPLQQLGDAIRARYAAYTESISRP